MTVTVISVILALSVIAVVELVRIKKLERYVMQLILDVDMLIQNSQTIDK